MIGRQPLRVCSGAFLVSELCAGDTALCSRVESFLGASAALYPEIEEWWRRRVLPDLRRRDRVCYIAREDGRLVGLCIGKVAPRSTKLCTLRVDDSVQSSGVGSRLLGRLFHDVAKVGGRQIHFTISEAVDTRCGAYFRRLGFSQRGYIGRPGRDAGDELIYAMSSASLTF
ncbi:MAG: GNAT family N-acetyltransferase [Nannocystis sp.]|uniref:GNAT family N-acetyltransferase n=1 Tax=Nannocystis sp. TaxID=1962667 RepID=UPI002427120C|nr:GNAT family N-acetyltransferase [Nannocystis sp.]